MYIWFFFIVIYILFMAIGPIIKQLKRQQQQQQRSASSTAPKQPPKAQSVQAKFEQYLGKIEEALTQQKSPPPLPVQASKLLSAPQELPVHHEDVLESSSRVETFTHQLLQEDSLPEFELHLREQKLTSLLAIDKRRGYMQGIILAEILGPPLSKRRKR